MERNPMKRAQHPPNSPDAAPSDFSLSGHVKQLLRGCEVADREAVLCAIDEILGALKNCYWKASLSAGWRDSANVVAPLENIWSKQGFA
jgi:hypothetical protein